MKRIILILLPAAFLALSACKNDTKEVNKVNSIVNDIEKIVTPSKQKALKNKVPLSKQELEDTFPFKIADYERDYLQVSDEMTTSEGAFGNGIIHLRIADAAGPLGKSLITMFNAIYESKEENSPTVRWQKKLRNNIKTINRYETDTQNASIEFIYINRFHVMLTGKNITPDELWNLFEFDNYLSSLKVLDDFDNKNRDRNH
jgi:hypothetical protein